MPLPILPILKQAPVVPLVTPTDAANAVATSKALIAGGLQAIEVVLRTDNAMGVFQKMIEQMPDALIGAGTVLSVEQAKTVIDDGAKFIVSPGLDEDMVKLAQDKGVMIFPGISTATELQRAYNLGLEAVKFFPAESSGGAKKIKDLSGPFRTMSFMPTGGVNTTNLTDYLAIPAVIACGGSWLTPKSAIEQSDFDAITQLARDALKIAKSQAQ